MEEVYNYIDKFYAYLIDSVNMPTIFFMVVIATISLGMLLGYMGKIVVYRDFKDLGVVFTVVLFPMTIFFSLMKLGVQEFEWLKMPFFVFISLMLVYIFVSTIKDNKSILKAIPAFLTKVPLGVLLILSLIEFIGPKKRQNRGYAFATMLFLTPLVVSLIDNKDNMPRFLKRFV